MDLKYPHLFAPIKIGNVIFKNRIFSAPISLQELSPELCLSTENIAFFELRAKGGVANVTVGASNVLDSGRGHTKELALDNPLIMPSLTHCARSIARHGAIPSIELAHAGKYAGIPNLENPHPKNEPFGPIHEFINGAEVKPWSEEQLFELAKAFGDGAALVKRAGFGMVMVHAAHGWLLSQFLSPTNTRDDQYGGSFENRMRFPIMVLEEIRKNVGPGFPIELRMNGSEVYEGGHGIEEAIKIAEALQDYVDIIHVSAGNQAVPETFVRTHPDMFYPHGLNVEMAAEIKKHVHVPVAVVGAITDPDKAEEIIASGKADIVEMARALMCDPFFPQKAKEGRDEDIRKCMRCHSCFDIMINTRDTACALNPVIGEEERYFSQTPASVKKKVLIAGGGPGGMQAAITAAQQGHNVILCEMRDKLGGKINCEAHVPFKKNFYEFIQWQQAQMKKYNNIEVRLNTKVDSALVEEVKPDAVICAIGADPMVPPISGIDDKRVIFCTDLEKGNLEIGGKVVIIGAGLVGSESAVHFLHMGKEVTLIEMRDNYAIDANPFHRAGLTRELTGKANILLSTKVKAITAEGVVVEDKDGNESVCPADTILCAVGMRALQDDVMAIQSNVMNFRAIGDCVRPGTAMTAIHHGYYAALDL